MDSFYPDPKLRLTPSSVFTLTPSSCRIYQQLGKTVDERSLVYRELFLAHLDQAVLTKIRTASNQGDGIGE
jgi:hypothetical protein